MFSDGPLDIHGETGRIEIMNIYDLLFNKILISIILILFVVACSEYDVASPEWDQNFDDVPVPAITSVSPSGGAVAGVNTITITGENFLDVPDTFGVYFDNVPAEIISNSETSITVRRPNLVAAGATIKVVPNQTLVVAKHGPYPVDPVSEVYGGFLDNLTLWAVAVDADENLYVVEYASPHNIIKITSSGEKETIGTTNYYPSRALIGPDGRLYLIRVNNREILVFDETTDTEASRWTRLPRGMTVSHGIFDSEGYFYAGGEGSDLLIVAPNPDVASPVVVESGFYGRDDILGITIYQNYIYVAVSINSPDASHPALSVWRHSLEGAGTLGAQELVLDLTTNEVLASRAVTNIKFDAHGNMFIGTDADDPLFINPAGSSDIDYFYKSILPSNCKQFCWGSGDYIYMIVGDDDLGVTWELYRVDMGAEEGS